MNVVSVHERFFEPFILSEVIAKRIAEIAKDINQDYADKNPLFLVILNGAFIFAADLLREVTVKNEVSFVKISSYEGMQSSGDVKELIGFSETLQGRHIVILEDIVDTGLSMQHILEKISTHQPASVKVTTLLLKPASLKVNLNIDYVGFEIESRFVLGYGMDYDGVGRNFQHIYVEKSDN